jgi:YfiR/HmsC-like
MTDSHKPVDYRCFPGVLPSCAWLALGARLRRFAALCFVTSLALLASQSGHAQSVAPADSASPDARADEVARIVGGIISFTRWPSDRAVVRLCVVTPAVYAEPLIRHAAENPARPVAAQFYTASDTHLESDCDAVYIEPVDEAAHEQLFQRLAGRPVLSIGGNDESCAMGSLFCLTSAPGAVSFAANLDAIARSGLRINPKVLLLARKEAGK